MKGQHSRIARATENTSSDPFFVEIRPKASAIEQFTIEYPADRASENQSCSVRWKHCRTQGAIITIVALVLITLGIAIWALVALGSTRTPLRVIGMLFACIPFLISLLIALSFYFDDHTETLLIYSDRIEHESASLLTHTLLTTAGLEDEDELAWPERYGWIMWIGYRDRYRRHRNPVRDAPVITRAQKPKLSFYAFGEAPECILVGHGVAMLIGPYLTQNEATHIAIACKRWIGDVDPREIAVELGERLQRPVNRREVPWSLGVWEGLLDEHPDQRLVSRTDDPLVVSIKYRYLTYQFGRDCLTIQETHLGFFKRRIQIPYQDVQEVRETSIGRLVIDCLSADSDAVRRVIREGDSLLASLLSLRTGRPVRPSRFKPR